MPLFSVDSTTATARDPAFSTRQRRFRPLPEPSPSNIFAEVESPMSQMARLQELQSSNPRYVKELMHRGEVLNLLAEHGNLRELQGAVRGFKHGDLLSFFVVRVFKTCMARGHVKILRFMAKSGFDAAHHVGIQCLLHEYAETGEGYALPACHFLIGEAGFDVDTARRGDYHTPLHVACARSRLPLVQLFLLHGADVNAVGKGGVTPLQLAAAAAAADPRDFKDAKKIVALLKAKGAKASWRSQDEKERPQAAHSTASAGAGSGDGAGSAGGGGGGGGSGGGAAKPEFTRMSFNLTHDDDEGDVVVPHPNAARAAAAVAAAAAAQAGAAAPERPEYTTTSFLLTGSDDEGDVVVAHPDPARAQAAVAAAAGNAAVAAAQAQARGVGARAAAGAESRRPHGGWSWERNPRASSAAMPMGDNDDSGARSGSGTAAAFVAGPSSAADAASDAPGLVGVEAGEDVPGPVRAAARAAAVDHSIRSDDTLLSNLAQLGINPQALDAMLAQASTATDTTTATATAAVATGAPATAEGR